MSNETKNTSSETEEWLTKVLRFRYVDESCEMWYNLWNLSTGQFSKPSSQDEKCQVFWERCNLMMREKVIILSSSFNN